MASVWTLTLMLLSIVSMFRASHSMHLYQALQDLNLDDILADELTTASDDGESTTSLPHEVSPTTAESLDEYADALFEVLFRTLNDGTTEDPLEAQLRQHEASLKDVYRNALTQYRHNSPNTIKSSSRLFKHWRLQNRPNQNPHLYTDI